MDQLIDTFDIQTPFDRVLNYVIKEHKSSCVALSFTLPLIKHFSWDISEKYLRIPKQGIS